MIDEVMPLVSRDGCQYCPYLGECELCLVYRCDKAQRLSDLKVVETEMDKCLTPDDYWRLQKIIKQLIKEAE